MTDVDLNPGFVLLGVLFVVWLVATLFVEEQNAREREAEQAEERKRREQERLERKWLS